MNKGRTLLLMGASGGVGTAIVSSLAKAGYNLALHYHESAKDLKIVTSMPEFQNIKVGFYQADITKEEDVIEMITKVAKDFGRIDVLVNNAGTNVSGISWKQDLEDWNKSIAINLTGPFLAIKYVLPFMRKQEFGRVINMSSVVAQMGFPGTSAYAAAKSGLFGMTKSISKEVANTDITVNNIALGYMEAGMLYEMPKDIRNLVKGSIPKQHFGKTEDITQAILYLANEKASYITGETINVNGGLY